MRKNGKLLWVIYYVDEDDPSRDRQYLFETDEVVCYKLFRGKIEQFLGGPIIDITYYRGHRMPKVVVDDDISMALAMDFFTMQAIQTGRTRKARFIATYQKSSSFKY
ncbi:uncharacterized protein EV154DRAFT_488302 [Mucor mucedo]|uniref:uncharacterized protein n=1 Tax=Mucor mucedo TaxID=29922 RepID=UPI002220CE8B|nr:uncharacterized protein EV154DRAFT_488302 [Mucor mucedo]KAI7867621.1 hypothetical protein EV154DRAFT_488302 [Mucor mucedo]